MEISDKNVAGNISLRRKKFNRRGKQMPEMTKEALEQYVEDKAKETVASAGKEWTDGIQEIVKEEIQEALKDFNKKIPTFEEELPREDPKGGFNTIGEFGAAIIEAGEGFGGLNRPNPSKELTKLQTWLTKSEAIKKAVGSPAQTAGSLEAGGALIPPEFSKTALTRARDRSNILGMTMTVPMSTDVISIPFIAGFDESQGFVSGNVKFRYVSENAQGTGNVVELGNVTLTLREANAIIYVSNRMIDFSPVSIQPFLTTALDDALDRSLSNSFIRGTGAGEPLGILNSDALITVPKETGQAAATLVYENTLKMLARFYGRSGTWFANRTTIPQLGVMNVAVGAGGSAVYIANVNGTQSAAGSFPASLHGSGLDYLDVMSQLGTTGDLGYIDWKQYLVGQRSGSAGLQMSESMHLKFDFRQTAFQATFYIDGQPWWPSAFSPLKGDSRSPYVVLATRA